MWSRDNLKKSYFGLQSCWFLSKAIVCANILMSRCQISKIFRSAHVSIIYLVMKCCRWIGCGILSSIWDFTSCSAKFTRRGHHEITCTKG
ncbi:uncharacterized protein LOC132200598 isoform X4 [Neocloeon triangulifer]|uniref:uncharacterized protein LOC132200598 isoform X4 n=1 Tax=Neocloeon triangulifer TaxID=2078957 RepID=UPI00286F22C8|nr:uncharacterized protein LOC132200598 isoform X4 [Neocloeon triangulifer]